MKFLALTSNDQGIIIDADDWDEAKLKLKKKIHSDALYKEIKLISLHDASEKNIMALPKMQGGFNEEQTQQLYNIADNLNSATKQLLDIIPQKQQKQPESNILAVPTSPLVESDQSGGDSENSESKQTNLKKQEACIIM